MTEKSDKNLWNDTNYTPGITRYVYFLTRQVIQFVGYITRLGKTTDSDELNSLILMKKVVGSLNFDQLFLSCRNRYIES